jgi:hypothetical protein
MFYKLVVFLHVISVFGFLLAHGATVAVSFALKQQRDMAKIRALLDLSNTSNPMMNWSLLSTIVFGVIAGFQANWWRFVWIWISLVLLVIIMILMVVLGANIYGKARKAAGLPYKLNGKPFPAETAKTEEEVFAILAKSNPVLLTIIGYGGYAVIAWLMMTKPF